MFERFGEFDSYEEINRTAEGLKEEGDIESLKVLAKENGLDPEDAEDYFSGSIAELTTPALAASGKIRLEVEQYKIKGILRDWIEELESELVRDENLAKAVRSKGKSITGYIAATAEYGYVNRAVVDKRIVEQSKVIKRIIGNHEFSIGIPDRRQRAKIMKEYYLGGTK